MNGPNRIIRVAIGPAPGPDEGPAAAHPGVNHHAIPPLVDIHEGPEGLVLEADLPGTTAESVSVQLEDNVLCLVARPEAAVPDGLKTIHEEFRPGEFGRSFILSDEVDRDRISAELRNGVLRLTLPKADRAKTRKIEIKSS